MRSALLDLLFAPICLACDGAISPGDPVRLICQRCRMRIRPVPPPLCTRCGSPRLRTGRGGDDPCLECRAWPDELRLARSACLLVAPADRIVHQLKYRGWHALARPMAERMAALSLPAELADARLVVAVPTASIRRRERGYNQAELIAGEFARETGRRLLPALQRAAGTRSQTALQPVARGANVAGAFRAVGVARSAIRDAHVLVVDDVLTTGATAAECARTLVAAGARCASVVTFARAPIARELPT